MGLGAIDVALHGPMRPSSGSNGYRPCKAGTREKLYPVSHAKELGVELHYLNTKDKDADYVKSFSAVRGSTMFS
jgi:hypothetical protein